MGRCGTIMENRSFVPPLPKTSYYVGPSQIEVLPGLEPAPIGVPRCEHLVFADRGVPSDWIADGVGALGQESQPSMSNVRLFVRLKGRRRCVLGRRVRSRSW